MTGAALGFSFKEFVAALGRLFVKAPVRRYRRRDIQLVGMQGRELRSDQVGIVRHVPKVIRRGNRELRGVVETRIEKVAFPVHFEVGDEGVPIRNRSPPRPGMQVYS